MCAALLGATVLLPTLPARANIFLAPRPPVEVRLKRLLLGTYAASWNVSGLDLGPGLGEAAFEVAPSPLLMLEYQVNDRLSVGGWYNPLSLQGSARGREFLEGSADFWDAHATYRFSERWSAQAGWSGIRQSLRAERRLPGRERGTVAIPRGTRFEESRDSLNFWVTRTQEVRASRPLSLYGSFGYYASDDFDRALNVILGGSMDLSPTLTASASVWLFNLQHQPETRLTAGLVARF